MTESEDRIVTVVMDEGKERKKQDHNYTGAGAGGRSASSWSAFNSDANNEPFPVLEGLESYIADSDAEEQQQQRPSIAYASNSRMDVREYGGAQTMRSAPGGRAAADITGAYARYGATPPTHHRTMISSSSSSSAASVGGGHSNTAALSANDPSRMAVCSPMFTAGGCESVREEQHNTSRSSLSASRFRCSVDGGSLGGMPSILQPHRLQMTGEYGLPRTDSSFVHFGTTLLALRIRYGLVASEKVDAIVLLADRQRSLPFTDIDKRIAKQQAELHKNSTDCDCIYEIISEGENSDVVRNRAIEEAIGTIRKRVIENDMISVGNRIRGAKNPTHPKGILTGATTKLFLYPDHAPRYAIAVCGYLIDGKVLLKDFKPADGINIIMNKIEKNVYCDRVPTAIIVVNKFDLWILYPKSKGTGCDKYESYKTFEAIGSGGDFLKDSLNTVYKHEDIKRWQNNRYEIESQVHLKNILDGHLRETFQRDYHSVYSMDGIIFSGQRHEKISWNDDETVDMNYRMMVHNLSRK